jgi:putative colanic acid biosynthesis glycosyltransferase
MSKEIIITIVTICFNNLLGLKRTKKSIEIQEFINYKWIIIDGGSTDGTSDYVNNFLDSNKNITFVSEPDKGIYDAMNKSIKFIQPSEFNYVIFMNSGDEFFNKNTLIEVESEILKRKNPTLLSFSANVICPNKSSYIITPRKISEAWTGMPTSHQAMYFNSKFFCEHGYDTTFKLGGDYNLYCHAAKKQSEHCYISDKIVCNFYLDGVSVHKRKNALKENFISRSKVLKLNIATCTILYLFHYLHFNLKKVAPNAMLSIRKFTR